MDQWCRRAPHIPFGLDRQAVVLFRGAAQPRQVFGRSIVPAYLVDGKTLALAIGLGPVGAATGGDAGVPLVEGELEFADGKGSGDGHFVLRTRIRIILSLADAPIMNCPAGTTTISGQVGQSLKLFSPEPAFMHLPPMGAPSQRGCAFGQSLPGDDHFAGSLSKLTLHTKIAVGAISHITRNFQNEYR
jgi:hypothetical protein